MTPDRSPGQVDQVQLTKTQAKALEGLRDPGYFHSYQYREQQLLAVKAGAHSRLVGGPEITDQWWHPPSERYPEGFRKFRQHRGFVPVFLKRMRTLGVPMYAHCIVRTAEEQQALFEGGQSRDSPQDDLWPHKAWAADIVHCTRHWNLNPDQWAVLGHIGKEVAGSLSLKMTWGGDWSFYDPAHWELTDWRSLA